MLRGAFVLASLALGLVQAIGPEPLRCLHKFYVKDDKYLSLDWDKNGTYIGEVENLSAVTMYEMVLASKDKYDTNKVYQMYITGYCIAPNGMSLLKLKNLGGIKSFDLNLQDRESVPAEYLAKLDPEGKAQKWMQLDMKADEEVEEFEFNIWPARPDQPYRVFLREKHKTLTLFPEKIEQSRISREIAKDHTGFPENHLFILKLTGVAEPPVANLDTSAVFLRQMWNERSDKSKWELNIPYLGVSWLAKTREGFWVQDGTKGVFHLEPYEDYEYVNESERDSPYRSVLGVILN